MTSLEARSQDTLIQQLVLRVELLERDLRELRGDDEWEGERHDFHDHTLSCCGLDQTLCGIKDRGRGCGCGAPTACVVCREMESKPCPACRDSEQ